MKPVVALILSGLLLSSGTAFAQSSQERPATGSIRASLEHLKIEAMSPPPRPKATQQPAPGAKPTHGSRMVAYVVGFAIIGGVTGALIGYHATKNCGCDDPGLGSFPGFFIGAGAGALVGVSLGQ